MKNTQLIIKNFLFWSAIILMVCSCSDKEEAVPGTLDEKIIEFIEAHQSENAPGLSVAVRKDNQIVYQGSKGIARLIDHTSINSNTQFRIGSVTKPMTAIAIMQLREKGKLQLQDKLLSYYPDLPQSFAEITIEHLLSHRSGMLDYIDDNSDISSLDNLPTSAVLGFFNDSGLENLNFTPGTSGRYSNTGYVLLALIIEKISGMSYPAYLEEHIFDPSGMVRSFVISENEHLGDNGDNYALSFGTDIKVKGFNSLIYGASGVASTINDMILFTSALMNYELISEESLDLMTQTVGAVPDIETDYGLGWLTGTGNYWHTGFITEPNDFWHSGGFDGYQTVLAINPDLDYEVIVLSNGGNATKEKMWDILALVRDHYKNL